MNNDEIRARVGRNLRWLREEKGLTQTDIGIYLDKKKSTIATWEAGDSMPDITTLYKLMAYYNRLNDLRNIFEVEFENAKEDENMGIFSKLTKAEPKEVKNKEYVFTQAKSFRGTKRSNISSHGDAESMDNLDFLSGASLKDSKIRIQDTGKALFIYVNDNKIGAIWINDESDAELQKKFAENLIETVYVKIDQESVNGIDRPHAYLFTK